MKTIDLLGSNRRHAWPLIAAGFEAILLLLALAQRGQLVCIGAMIISATGLVLSIAWPSVECGCLGSVVRLEQAERIMLATALGTAATWSLAGCHGVPGENDSAPFCAPSGRAER